MNYKLQYIDFINAFHNWCYDHPLSKDVQIIFLKILHIMNLNRWEEWVEISNVRLMDFSDFSNEKTFIRCRDKLIELGFIEYQKGKKRQPNRYRLVKEFFIKQKQKYTCKFASQNYSITDSESDSISDSISDRHNKREEKDKDNNITRINTRNIIAQSDKKIITHEPKREEENIFIKIPLINGEEYPIGQGLVEEYKKLYLNVDVEQELRKMKAWIISNPQKRKTKRGILRFVNNWLSKEQDKNSYSKNLGNKGKLNNRSPSYDIKAYENYSIFDQKTEDDDEWGVGDMNTVYKPKEGEEEYTEEEKRLLAKAWKT